MTNLHPAPGHGADSSSRRRPTATGHGSVHGTFGELLQGYRWSKHAGYEHFLFTVPVDELASEAVVTVQEGTAENTITPSDRQRALAAVTELAEALELVAHSIDIRLSSSIPVGKGCASSTADIMAATSALLDAVHPGAPDRVSKALGSLVARHLEWGDYVNGNSIAWCFQERQALIKRYVTTMNLHVVGIDEGSTVDTAEYHQRETLSRVDAATFEALAARLDRALEVSDAASVGEVATESARINQHRLPKRTLPLLERVGDDLGAVGVVVAHSGTVAGLLFAARIDNLEGRLDAAESALRSRGENPRRFTVLEGAQQHGLSARQR